MKRIFIISIGILALTWLLAACSTDFDPTPRRKVVNRDSTSSGGGVVIGFVFDDAEDTITVSLDGD